MRSWKSTLPSSTTQWREAWPEGLYIIWCIQCQRPYERHPFMGVLTCFVHPSYEETKTWKEVWAALEQPSTEC